MIKMLTNEEVDTINEDLNLVLDPEDELMLTTLDNPFSPKNQYPQWKTWDAENGYFTEEYIARVANIPVHVDIDDELTVSRYTNAAIHSILDNDTLGIYKLV